MYEIRAIRLFVGLACGAFCDSCELNGISKCDVDRCNSTGLRTGVVYSNTTQTCVRKWPPAHMSAPLCHYL